VKKIICLYGGPGSGKTTTMAGTFALLKNMGYNCEMIPEYVKNWVWEGRDIKPGDQTYFFAKQSRLERVFIMNNMDFIITDSPLILTHFYGLKYDIYEQRRNTSAIMLEHHHEFTKDHGYKVEHIFMNRIKAYNPAGRYQDESGAIDIDGELKTFLNNFPLKYHTVDGNGQSPQKIIELLKIPKKE
jgi:hypothetical protein